MYMNWGWIIFGGLIVYLIGRSDGKGTVVDQYEYYLEQERNKNAKVHTPYNSDIDSF